MSKTTEEVRFDVISGERSGVAFPPLLNKCAFEVDPLVLKIIGLVGSKSAS
jgi:hypothetical protein